VGYLAKKSFQSNTNVHTAHSDLHIAFLSQQQLKSFNLPYQLGFTNIENTPNAFESPTDADTASISGMIIVYLFVIAVLFCKYYSNRTCSFLPNFIYFRRFLLSTLFANGLNKLTVFSPFLSLFSSTFLSLPLF